jgi:hypothetical protein
MMIENAIRKILLDNPRSSDALKGIYVLVAPQEAGRPYAVIWTADRSNTQSLTGPSGLGSCMVQIDVAANTIPELKEAADSMREALDGFQGTVTPTGLDSPEPVEIQSVELSGGFNGYDEVERVPILTQTWAVEFTESRAND